ncbi:hypothetical protein BOX15_Mlig003050g6, partial [Macrostomum lignano]
TPALAQTMVVFTCEACNESLKKNKVEQHLYRCRRARHVTCIDCQVDFDRESFKSHTSCISEMEKYSGPGYVAKPSANKGAKKQDDWFQRVQSAIDSCHQHPNSPLSRVLYKVRESSNVPRKQAKFINFCRNSLPWVNQAVIQQAWDLLTETAAASAPTQNSNEADSKKRSADAEAAADDEEKPAVKKAKKSEESSLVKADDEEAEEQAQLSSKKNKKKKKKDREIKEESSQFEAIEADVALPEAEVEENPEKKQKKKKKKSKLADPDQEELCAENGELLNIDETPTKKKKKSMEQTESKDAEPAAAAAAADETADCFEANGDSTVERKKSKKKKRKSSQNGIDRPTAEQPDEPVAAAAAELSEKKKKKKKKRKQKEAEAEASMMTACSVISV